MKLLLRSVLYLCIITVFTAGVAAIGFVPTQKQFWLNVRKEPIPSLEGVITPIHDPNKPTVAVLLGNENTEGLDFTIPYQLFSMTDSFNVYAVAEDRQVRTLTGGLDVVPHYSFKELDELLGKSADIIAIPYMTMNDPKSYEPIREWLLKHKDATLLSICTGADNLAATGLLDGKNAASHWQTIDILTRKYPEVTWIRDQRYVISDDKMISSAGISSGIDATLYLISKKLGEPAAAQLAKELNYPSYHFIQNPKVEPFYINMGYLNYFLNNAFQWNKTDVGVLLYNGVEEMALASVFDIYSDTGTTRVLSVGGTGKLITTNHGLNLITREVISQAPQFDKWIVPGKNARSLAAKEIQALRERGGNPEPQYVHNDAPNRFLFEVQLEDLAKQEDLLTAKHAVKRLEYRAEDIRLDGKPFSFETYGALLLTITIAILIAFMLDKRLFSRKGTKNVQFKTAR